MIVIDLGEVAYCAWYGEHLRTHAGSAPPAVLWSDLSEIEKDLWRAVASKVMWAYSESAPCLNCVCIPCVCETSDRNER
jgi:hypothetical protein